METYGVDLRDIFVPEARLSPKWVLTLIKELPIGSRFYADKRGGPQFRKWDQAQYTLASIVNAVRALQFVYLQSHTKKKLKEPEAYPTPQAKTKKSYAPNSFGGIVAQMVAAKRARKAAE